MTKEEIRNLIQELIQEYMGTGDMSSTGLTSDDGNNMVSQRDPGGSFTTAADGGAEGQHTRGMEYSRMGNPNSQKQVKF